MGTAVQIQNVGESCSPNPFSSDLMLKWVAIWRHTAGTSASDNGMQQAL